MRSLAAWWPWPSCYIRAPLHPLSLEATMHDKSLFDKAIGLRFIIQT